MEDGTASISPTQRRALETLKRHGAATAEELAVSLDVSPSAVRQHLAALRAAGFVTSTPDRSHAGRPADRYHATSRSEEPFGRGEELAVQILDFIEDEDPALVDRLFERRRNSLVARSAITNEGTPIEERVTALAELLDAEGYLAEVEATEDGRYCIHLRNCPIWAVANRYEQACSAELGAVQDLIPNGVVTRTTHKTAGTHTCTYEIEPAG